MILTTGGSPTSFYEVAQPVSLSRQVNSAYLTLISPPSIVTDNTQTYPDQSHFLTGTHIAMKAVNEWMNEWKLYLSLEKSKFAYIV